MSTHDTVGILHGKIEEQEGVIQELMEAVKEQEECLAEVRTDIERRRKLRDELLLAVEILKKNGGAP